MYLGQGSSSDFTVISNVPYVRPPDSMRVGDIYIPKGSSQLRPAVVLIHGGGWEGGSKNDEISIAHELAEQGFVVFNINYRLLGRGGEFPGDVIDVKDAVAFLVSKSRDYRVDVKKIAIMGSSAGGYLAMMSAYTPNTIIAPQYHTATSVKIAAVVSWFGPTDLTILRCELVERYLFKVRNNGYRVSSPITYASSAVPTLLVHGTADKLVPFSQSQKLFAALRAKHIDSEFLLIKGDGHGFEHGWLLAVNKTLAFLNAHLSVGHR